MDLKRIIAKFTKWLKSNNSEAAKTNLNRANLIDDNYITSLFDSANRRLADHQKEA